MADPITYVVNTLKPYANEVDRTLRTFVPVPVAILDTIGGMLNGSSLPDAGNKAFDRFVENADKNWEDAKKYGGEAFKNFGKPRGDVYDAPVYPFSYGVTHQP